MKKLKLLGIATGFLVALAVAAIALAAIFGGFTAEKPKDEGPLGGKPITVEPEELLPTLWQTGESSGDGTAVIKTDLGEVTFKITPGGEGLFANLGQGELFFEVLAENFVQSSAFSESFSAENPGLLPLYGAVGFVLEERKAASLLIITQKELAVSSRNFIKTGNFPEEKAEIYREFGGVPEFEQSVVIFGQVTGGFEILEQIAAGESTGYTGGFKAISPINFSLEIIDFS